VASEKILRDVPSPVPQAQEHWGSDAIAAMLRELGVPYLALNPGASYRGLHDSIVNLPRQREAADAPLPARGIRDRIAHGYAKAPAR
jgi:hypothetical protein